MDTCVAITFACFGTKAPLLAWPLCHIRRVQRKQGGPGALCKHDFCLCACIHTSRCGRQSAPTRPSSISPYHMWCDEIADHLDGNFASPCTVMGDRMNKGKYRVGMDEYTQGLIGLSKTTPSDVMQWLNKRGECSSAAHHSPRPVGIM